MSHPPVGVPSAVTVTGADGCDRAYGLPTQCVPLHAPGGAAVTCAFLTAYGLLPLLVTDDHLGLAAAPGARTEDVRGARYLVGCTP